MRTTFPVIDCRNYSATSSAFADQLQGSLVNGPQRQSASITGDFRDCTDGELDNAISRVVALGLEYNRKRALRGVIVWSFAVVAWFDITR